MWETQIYSNNMRSHEIMKNHFIIWSTSWC